MVEMTPSGEDEGHSQFLSPCSHLFVPDGSARSNDGPGTGLGQFFVRGALNRDYTLVLGIVIFYATLIISLNLLVDILYGVIDPRVRKR